MGSVPFEYDATLKQLFAYSVRGLLTQLAGSPVAELLDTGLPRVNAPWIDLLARLHDGTLFHLEFQTTHEPAFAWRAARYYLDIWERYGGRAASGLDATRDSSRAAPPAAVGGGGGTRHDRWKACWDESREEGRPASGEAASRGAHPHQVSPGAKCAWATSGLSSTP